MILFLWGLAVGLWVDWAVSKVLGRLNRAGRSDGPSSVDAICQDALRPSDDVQRWATIGGYRFVSASDLVRVLTTYADDLDSAHLPNEARAVRVARDNYAAWSLEIDLRHLDDER